MPLRLVRDLRQDRLTGRAGAVAQAVLRGCAAARFCDADDFAVNDQTPDVAAHGLPAADADAVGKVGGRRVKACRVGCSDFVKDHALATCQHRALRLGAAGGLLRPLAAR